MSHSPESFFESVVPKLPQAKHIKYEDACAWFESVTKNDPDRLMWHASRLSGLGGSDIGEIAVWHMGYPNQFKTPKDIVRDKLMQNPVGMQTPQMRRGSLLEPAIRKIFHEDFKTKTELRLKDRIDNAGQYVSLKHKWMKGNVDDVVYVDGKTYIVDYKSTSHVPDSAPLPYAAQVHQYAHMLAEATGEDPFNNDYRLLICYFDYPSGEVVPIEVPFDQDIMNAIKEGGDHIWEHVLNGTYPEIKSRKNDDLVLSDDQQKMFRSLEQDLVLSNLYSCAAKNYHQENQDKFNDFLRQIANDSSLKNKTLPFEVMNASVRSDIDHEELQNIIKNTGVDEDSLKSASSNKFDEDKVKDFLKQHKQKLKDFKKMEFDTKKIIEFCDQNNLSYPFTEKVSPFVKSTNKKINQEALKSIKSDCHENVRAFIDNMSHGGDADIDLISSLTEEKISQDLNLG